MAPLNPAIRALYVGRVRHRRFAPVLHQLDYELRFPLFDLGAVAGDAPDTGHPLWSVGRAAPVWLRRADYHGDPKESLESATRSLVERETGQRPSGPILLLSHPRYLGLGFNPVSFYYCLSPDERQLEAVVAEVSNTPWGERRCYVLPASESRRTGGMLEFRFAKAFHVSPFMSMQQEYRWTFTTPGNVLRVHMDVLEGGKKLFDATLKLRRHPATATELTRTLIGFPPMTLKVFAAIYWNAARLWLKRAPYYPHPKTLAATP